MRRLLKLVATIALTGGAIVSSGMGSTRFITMVEYIIL
jgi:hypothetical protein